MATDLTTIASVTRANLDTPLAELDINDLVNYSLGRAVRMGSVTWRKEAATSPYVDGRVIVHETRDAAEGSLVVYCMGDTHATLETNLSALLTAFTKQYSYQVKLQVEGVDHHWECERADYEVGYVTETVFARRVPVSLSFMRSPIAVQGSF